MESVVTGSFDFVRGRRVLVTGHTGFKGAWLSEWLLGLGAELSGLALPPDAPNSLFETLKLESRMKHIVCDIRNETAVRSIIAELRPEIVFHLAAQALVRRSYREPIETWTTNVLGTMHLLEALRATGDQATVVAVTTDKVYRNREWVYAYREVDELGGHDPYSASKAGCEIAVSSWRASFASDSGVRVATARAGNVLGGGDNAEDRIVPDCYRAWKNALPVEVRNPSSTRPWQHVLEPLSGYLRLGEELYLNRMTLDCCNFGPGPGGDRTVRELVAKLASFSHDRRWIDASSAHAPHEARSLSLSIDRAKHELGWQPVYTFDETLRIVEEGYAASTARLPEVVAQQIDSYQAAMRGNGVVT